MSFELQKLKNFNGRKGPLLMIVMDGIGIGKEYEGNAIFAAKTPVLDKYFNSELYTQLQAHGTAVGLPSDADMGNSEVGHNALGAGRVFAQGAKRVNLAIKEGSIYESDVWKTIIERSTDQNGTLHFMGLLSDGNVHSNVSHLFAMMNKAAKQGVKTIRIHALLDGRDVPEKSAMVYLQQLNEVMKKLRSQGVDCEVGSGGGRMVTTMDRYFADWDVVKNGWDTHVLGKGRQFKSAEEAIQTYYDEDPEITDQYLPSFVIARDGEPVGTIEDGDNVIFFNYRGDRAIEISMAFEKDDFDAFDRERRPDVFYTGMMEYDGDLHVPKNYLVSPPEIDKTIGQYLCGANVKSFAISETQKFGHVTYFWNGNNSGYIDEACELYEEIPSDKIQFDKKPEMKANEIGARVQELLKSEKFKFGRINFANGDMVGHTGKIDAAIIAVETVDKNVGELIELVNQMNGITVVTADHGNADIMWTEKKGVKTPFTAHTLNPVPFFIVDSGYNGEYEISNINNPGLANVAATIFNLLGYEAPEEYDPSLITFKK